MMKEQLGELRNEIDAIDRRIVKLIARRAIAIADVAAISQDLSELTTDDRLQAVISNVRAEALRWGTSPDVLEAVYRTLTSEFIERDFQVSERAS